MTVPLTVLSAVSEMFPLVKTGGLADVAGALPGALAAEDVRMVTLIPGYPVILDALANAGAVATFPDLFGGPARLLAGRAGALDLLVIDAPHLYRRAGNPYVGPHGSDWSDNALRFAALSLVAARIGGGEVESFVPDLVHAHDWQAGLAAAYLHYAGKRRPGTVMTVHNLAYQGVFPPAMLSSLMLPAHAFQIDGVEFHGSISFLKAGLVFSDAITTVSPTYAAEIRTPEAGMGFDGLLRARAGRLRGILNGIDDAVWSPATDTLIAAPYDAHDPAPRARNKAALQQRFGLAPGDALLFGVISRLTWQKGLDMLLEVLPALVGTGAQLALLGSGDRALEEAFVAAARHHPGRVGCLIGYDETVAHLIQAGADALLVPSRFEPCGLTQLCALRYGALPVVARVGGLADTVIDANEMALADGIGTGFQFAPATAGMLEAAILRAAALWRDQETWRLIRANAMATDVSWRRPAWRYAELYREVLAGLRKERPDQAQPP